MGAEAGRERPSALRVGDAITLDAAPRAHATVTGPDGRQVDLAADPSGTIRYPRTDRAGVYRLAVGPRPAATFAVNLLDEDESNIAPVREIVLSSQAVQAQPAEPRRTNQPIGPFLAILAMALVCAEWLVYNSKVRL